MLSDWTQITPEQLVETHLAKTPNTARGYRQDLEAFAAWMSERTGSELSMSEAAQSLIDGGRAQAKRTMIAWINDMRGKQLAAGTIRRMAASIKSLISLASDPDIEVIPWQIGKLPNLPSPCRVRDVRGPDRAAVERMIDTCRIRGDHIGARNEAIIGLLYWHGLRANEVMTIRLQDIDLTTPSVRILAKRGQGRMTIGLCRMAADAIEKWLDYRGTEPGNLFLCCRRMKKSVKYDRRLRCRKLVTTRPLSYWGMRGMIRSAGEAAGVRCWPHGLRHAAISHLAALTDDSPIWGIALSRHKDMSAWSMYQDRQVSHLAAAEVLSRGRVVRREPDETDNLCW